MIYKVLNQLLQSQNFRLKICCRQCKHARFIITRSSTLFYLRNKGKVYYTKVRLQICFCKKLIQNNLCDCTFFQINYKTHTRTVRRFIVSINYTVNLLIADKLLDAADNVCCIYAIRNFCKYNRFFTAFICLNCKLRTDNDFTASCCVSFFDSGCTINNTTGREIRTFDIVHQFFNCDFLIIDISTNCIGNFAKVMGWHICCHTNGNTSCTVTKQEWEL